MFILGSYLLVRADHLFVNPETGFLPARFPEYDLPATADIDALRRGDVFAPVRRGHDRRQSRRLASGVVPARRNDPPDPGRRRRAASRRHAARGLAHRCRPALRPGNPVLQPHEPAFLIPA